YGMQTAKKMIPVQHETLDFRINGYIGKPEITRANRNYISLIVNGRFIRNHMVNKGILEGYHTLLPIGRFPIVVLNIEMDPYLVDVNVHPAKLEVRFSKEKELFEAVAATVKKAFQKEVLIPSGGETKKTKEKSFQASFTLDNRKLTTDSSTPLQRQDYPWDELINIGEKDVETKVDTKVETKESSYNPSFSNEIFADDYDVQQTAETEEETVEQQKRVPMLYP